MMLSSNTVIHLFFGTRTDIIVGVILQIPAYYALKDQTNSISPDESAGLVKISKTIKIESIYIKYILNGT